MSAGYDQFALTTDADGREKCSADITIILPCWRDDAVQTEAVARWMQIGVAKEVLIAAANSGDGVAATQAWDDSTGCRVVHCPRSGRGHQMNQAARQAKGDVLLFNHVDTQLDEEHLRSLHTAMADARVVGGAFRRRFDERHPHLRWLEGFEALRCRCFGPLFGDQSIFVRRSVFEALGGFAEIPLMEDVEFTNRLRKQGRLVVLEPAILSSARKHLQQGRWRTTIINAAFLLFFALGVSPARLHAWYYRRH